MSDLSQQPGEIATWATIARRMAQLISDFRDAEDALVAAPSAETLREFMVARERFHNGAQAATRMSRESDALSRVSDE